MDVLIGHMAQPAFWVAVLQIIGVNVILSGDNAVVIALACRMLPQRQRVWGMVLGAGVAVLLRVLFTLVVSQAMDLPYLKLGGGLLLFWVAIKLVVPEQDDDASVKAADNLWRAVWIVAVADIVMSLDNVIAIAASAETAALRVDPGHVAALKNALIVFGLATSVPLIVAGSAVLMALLDRFPILVWAGAALLGWVAGDIMIKDGALNAWLTPEVVHRFDAWSAAAGAVFVITVGWLIRRAHRKDVVETSLSVGRRERDELPRKG